MNDDSIKKSEYMFLWDVYEITYSLLSQGEKEQLEHILKSKQKKLSEDEALSEDEEISKQSRINAYIDNHKKQLGNICNVLGFTFKDLDVLKEGYRKGVSGKKSKRIPVALAPVLVAILRSRSERGGYINKIVTENFDKITPEEKEDFLKILHEELIRAKTYSKSITDETIESIINGLKYQVDLSDKLIASLETGMFQTIKRDIFNINKAGVLTGVGMPNLSWIKDFATNYNKALESLELKAHPTNCTYKNIPECVHMLCEKRKKCDESDRHIDCTFSQICNKCSDYNTCRSEYKTSELFRDFNANEKSIFTDIYIGMMLKARETFIMFMEEYKDRLDRNYFESDDNIDIDINENIKIDEDDEPTNMIKQSVKETLFDDSFDIFVCDEILEKLAIKGINANKAAF